MTKESRGIGQDCKDRDMSDISTDMNYDLDERTARFGEAIIDFARMIPVDEVTERFIKQLVGAGTSVGANYCEADNAVSKRDFKIRQEPARKRLEKQSFLAHDCQGYPEFKGCCQAIVARSQGASSRFRQIWRS